MGIRILKLCLTFSIVIFLAVPTPAEKGRIYGKIYTDIGDVLEGPIRWDINESSWDDMIDGNKEREKKKSDRKRRKKYRDRRSSSRIKLFGLTIGDNDIFYTSSRQAAIPFGFIKKLTPISNNGAELLLQNGEEVTIEGSSTDLGTGIREIVIETSDEGMLELDWYDIDYIEFMDGGDVESDFGEKIYGTVSTDRVGEFTGWIVWDVDESFTKDIIDGRDRRRKRKIKFEQITSIEKISSQASEITTKEGKTMRLDDSNDVDSGNRGIAIADKNLGRVNVEWDEFERLDIKTPPADAYPSYSDYAKCGRLVGTVYDEDGNEYSGYIRWDDDEEYGWEVLDGSYRDVEFDIVMRNIKSIEKLSRRGSRVTLWDGRSFKLRESNDVDDDNNGIFIYPKDDEDDEIIIEWEDFSRIEFEK
ncbi:MAG: hypothetical protein V3V99_09785 [candidate division Zixibacteria bacterium]